MTTATATEMRAASPSRQTFGRLCKARENNFDFLRFFMAFVVIYTHAFALAGVTHATFRSRLLHGDFGGAWIAVDFFFVISGFLITQSYLNSRGSLDYWKKRILRIYPGFAASLIFCVFVVGPLAGVSLHEYFTHRQTYAYFQALILRDTTAPLPGVFTHLPFPTIVNGSLWTIRFELLCYAIVFALGVVGLLRSRRVVLGLFLVSLAVAAAETFSFPNHAVWTSLIHAGYFGNVYEMPRFVYCFLAGTAFFLFREEIPFSLGLAVICVAALAITPAAIFSLALPIFGTYVLFYFAFHRRIPLKNFGRHGDFSYGLYLYAFPVEQLVVLHSHATIRPWPLLGVSFAITMVIAVLSWHLLEHPFLRLKGGRRNARAASAASIDAFLPRVMLLTDADVFAGTERHILSLAVALRNRHAEVLIGCPAPSPLADQAAALKIEVTPIPKRGLIDWQAARQIRHLVKSGRIQLVHAHNGRTRLAAAIGMWGTSGNLVASQHFIEPAHTRRRGLAAKVSRILHHWMNGRVDKFIAVSQAVADAMGPRENIGRERIAVIHNGLALASAADLRPAIDVRRELGIDPQAPLVVCAARLEEEKDVASLITAMQTVRQDIPAVHCVIAGKGSLRQAMAAQIRQLDLQDHVRLLGFRSDVPALMSAADVFVLPSVAEPFGLVLLEAMAFAKPVVATRVAGPLEIVQEGKTGLLVPPSDSPALAAALIRLLADRSWAATLGQRGRRRLESCFTDDRMAAATAAVYHHVISAA